MPYKDPEQQRTAQREWARNERAAEQRAEARARRLAWLNEQKDKPCADCGVKYPPYVMDFDHLGDKEGTIRFFFKYRSFAALKAEVAKCEVVCANCHRERSWSRGQHLVPPARFELALTP